ncbi:MAG: RuBisCO large subunit C-terminal-like domain-containing protein [Syntrophomonadaceae bacterium]|nr:RuBisCO large subunit C-terminal-like domain-containing protein [Syntrophomonadaceae bacterium]
MLSGERFQAVYRLAGSREEALQKAKDICLEQTVEFPEELVPPGTIRDWVVGRLESFEPCQDHYRAVVSYAAETAAGELTQLLNVLFGNISIKPGYRLEQIDLPPSMLANFRGPRFGRAGLRDWLGVYHRPLLFTTLKPMGLSAAELAERAYWFALGGIDLIKDDHGITNQSFAPFAERVKLCARAVAEANRVTGGNSVYVANITSSYDEIVERARTAKAAGARGLMIAPAITGLDTMRRIADDDSIGLPVFSHPAFQGSYLTSEQSGMSHQVLLGQISRLAGADAVIYPNFGGRFSFSREECESIARGSLVEMGRIKPSFPSPGGGMSLERIPEMLEVYGRDVIFLIGGGLFKRGPDLVENSRYFRKMIEQLADGMYDQNPPQMGL